MEERKVVFVTGGSRGIGKAIALKYAQNGYNVVINYVSDKTNVEELKKKFEELKVECLIEKADVSKSEEVEQIVKKTIEKFKKIDVLINNAGITRDGLLMRMKEEDFDKVIEINLKGTFLVTKSVIPYMLRNIRANAIAPGFIDTDMTSVLSDEVKDSINAQIPMKRMGTAQEIANVAYFLGCEESSYITGQVINIDGGMVM